MARKNLFAPSAPSAQSDTPSPAPMPRPASGAGPMALMRQELKNTVRDIRTELIDGSPLPDRIPGNDPALDELVESIRLRGQLVPALVRPSAADPKRFEIVYGRRRLAAARELGQPLKAVVHDLSDLDALIAQGAENNRRLDPSFIEKAIFASRLAKEGDCSTEVIAEIIAAHTSDVSRMTKIVASIGEPIILEIGPCHGIGRRPWQEISDLMGRLAIKRVSLGEVSFSQETDLERFEHFRNRLEELVGDEALPGDASETSDGGVEGATGDQPAIDTPKRVKLRFGRKRKGSVYLERNKSGVSLRFRRGKDTTGFEDWLTDNVDDVLGTIQELWLKQTEQPEKEQ